MRWWLAVMLLSSGCAFGLSGPAPDHPRSKMPKCDTGKGLVVLDGLMAATAGVVAAGIAGENEPSIALLPLGIGALYMAGAVTGNTKVNKCRKAMGEYEEYLAEREAMPLGGGSRGADDEDDVRGALARQSALPAPEPATQTMTPAPPTTLATRPAAPQPQPQPQPATPVAASPEPEAEPAQPARPTPAVKGPAQRAKPAPKRDVDDDWTDFWREVEP